MNTKSNSFKNIITVLLALLLLGMAAGTASAGIPNVTSATLNYSTGVLVVTFSENVVTNSTDATKFYLNNVTTVPSVQLSVAPTGSNGSTLTFTLTEGERVAALAISGRPGGDGGAVILEVAGGGVISLSDGTPNDVVANQAVTETSSDTAVLTTITVSNASVIVGGNTTFTAATKDQYNNAIAATVNWSSSNTSVGTINAGTGVFLGIAAGTTTISATNGSVTGNATATVTSATAVLTTITVSNASVLVGSNTTFTATKLDQYGANFNATVTWSSSNTSVGTINASTGVFMGIAAGTTTINATNGSVTGTATATVGPVVLALVINSTTYGNLTDMNGAPVSASGNMVAGVPTVFKINVTDQNGLLYTGFTGTVTISSTMSGTPNLTTYTFVAADNGSKSISVTDNVAETIVVNFNSTSVTTNATTSKTVLANKPAKLVFNSSMPLSTLTNSLQVKISVTDAYNNLINASKLTGASGFPINATQLGGTDGLGLGMKFNLTLSLPTAGSAALDNITVLITNANVNTNVAYVNDTVDQTVVLGATASFFNYITTNLNFLAPVSNILVSTNKTNNTAHANTGANSLGSINITAQLRDALGNALSVPGSVITFSSDNTEVLNVASQTATTDASGQAILNVSTTYVAGTANITTSDSTGHVGTVTITTTAVIDNTTSTLIVNTTARAGDNVTVSATIKDYAGTVVPAGTTVSFNITSGDSTSTLNSVAKGTIVTATTNSTGVAAVTFRATNASGVHSINATIVDEQSVTRMVGPSVQNITVSSNDAAVLVVSPANKGLANIQGQNVVFTITAYDAYNNLNTSIGSLKINVSTTNPSLGNMTQTSGSNVTNYAVITASSGVGAMTYTVNSTTPDSATLTFAAYINESSQVSNLVYNITKTVSVTTSGARLVTITPSAAGAAVNTNIGLTVNLTDADGNLIGIDGTNMSLTSSAGTLGSISLTSISGQASTTVTSSTPGDVTVTVFVAGLTSAATTVTFSGNATTFTMTPTSSPVAVNGITNITIQAYDASNNKATIYNGAGITGQSGVLTSVSGLTFSATSFTFNATGYAMVNVTSATPGTYTIQAAALGLVKTTNVIFTGSTIPVLTYITVANASVGIGNTTTFTAITQDQNHATMTGITVTWNSSNASVGTINSTTGVFTAIANGTSTITATNGSVTGTATATVGSRFPPEVAVWDANNDGVIQKSEAVSAVLAYFATPPAISKADAIKVVLAYFG